jgi:hypothetical protein
MKTATPYEVSTSEANAALRKIYEHAEDNQISASDAFQTERGKLVIDLARQAGIELPVEAMTNVDATLALAAQVSRVADALEALKHHITGR